MNITVHEIIDELGFYNDKGNSLAVNKYFTEEPYSTNPRLHFSTAENIRTFLSANLILEGMLRGIYYNNPLELTPFLMSVYSNLEHSPLDKNLHIFEFNRSADIGISSQRVKYSLCLRTYFKGLKSFKFQSEVKINTDEDTYFKIREWFTERGSVRSSGRTSYEPGIAYQEGLPGILKIFNYAVLLEETLFSKPFEERLEELQKEIWAPLTLTIEYVKDSEHIDSETTGP